MLPDERITKSIPETPDRAVELSRRDMLRNAAVFAGGVAALATALTATRAEAKNSQAAAAYQGTPKNGQSCSTCALFRPPSSCLMVEGTISPDGWCKFYVKKS
jgi:High potential iron-sulfur protein